MGPLFHTKKRTSKDGGHYFILERERIKTAVIISHEKRQRLKTAVIISHEKENV